MLPTPRPKKHLPIVARAWPISVPYMIPAIASLRNDCCRRYKPSTYNRVSSCILLEFHGCFRSKLVSVCCERGNLNLELFFPFSGLTILLTSVLSYVAEFDESPIISIGFVHLFVPPIICDEQARTGRRGHFQIRELTLTLTPTLSCSYVSGSYVLFLFRAIAIMAIQRLHGATWSLESCTI